MLARWQAWAERINGMSLRERGMLLLSLVVVAYSGWQFWFMAPLEAHRMVLAKQGEALSAEILELNRQTQAIVRRSNEDPDKGVRQRLAGLKQKDRLLDVRMQVLQERLVPPQRMSEFLRSMLTAQPDLSLVSLTGLGASAVEIGATTKPAGSGTAGKGSEIPISRLYRHAVRMEFEGGYLAALAYLRALEALEWNFFWQDLELEVLEHPRARIGMTVYTLSLDDGWIGV